MTVRASPLVVGRPRAVLARLHAVPWARRRLLVRAVVCLLAGRILLVAGAINRAERLLPAVDAVPASLAGVVAPDDRPRPRDVGWAVETAARHLPGRYTCLVKAVAARVLLGRHGHESRLRIGVRTAPAPGTDQPATAEGFGAHAWVVAPDGAVLVGSLPDLDSFRPIPLDSLDQLGR